MSNFHSAVKVSPGSVDYLTWMSNDKIYLLASTSYYAQRLIVARAQRELKQEAVNRENTRGRHIDRLSRIFRQV